MSLFLLYYDDGPLHLLAGKRGSIFFDEISISVRCGGASLATQVLSICYNWSSAPFRIILDPLLHRELLLFVTERRKAGRTPHLFFHWFQGSEDTVEVTGVVAASVLDVANLFEILHDLPDDTVVEITDVVNPVQVSIPE